jgi:hypothetical protein
VAREAEVERNVDQIIMALGRLTPPARREALERLAQAQLVAIGMQ